MPNTPQLSVTPSTTTSASGSAKRRSIRIPRQSEEVVSSMDIGNVMGDKKSEKKVVQTNALDSGPPSQLGWKHPAELQYIRRDDWSQDLMITYLCQKAFTVPPRQLNTTLSYTEITRSFSGEKIQVPRGYRIPLMFVAKFQWESLSLVLNNTSEWEEYKFDIIHLSRLCTHFFKQAKSAASENKLNKGWRSPMLDRALIRFYRKWLVSREWSVKKFWEEYDEDEYKLDVLKFDWSRWVLKGHKGFVLSKEEVQDGFTANKYTDRLKRRPDGTWRWGGDDSGPKSTSPDALTCLTSQDAVEAITDATPSHDSGSEVKRELLRELLHLHSDDVALNINGKRLRGDDGDSPQKSSTQEIKRKRRTYCPQKTVRRKFAVHKSPEPEKYSSSSSSSSDNDDDNDDNDDNDIDDNDKDWRETKRTAKKIPKNAAPQSFSLTKNLSLSHKHEVAITNKPGKSTPSTTMVAIPTKREVASTNKPGKSSPSTKMVKIPTKREVASTNKPGKSTPSTEMVTIPTKRDVASTSKPGKSTPSTTMVTIPTDVPSDHHLDPLRLIFLKRKSPRPFSTARKMEDLVPRASTQPEDDRDTVLPVSTDESRGEGICPRLPLLPSDTRVLNPILKTIPKPWPTKPLHIAASVQSQAGSSSSPASGISDVFNDAQESNPISQTTPINSLMQIDNADPETMPNAEVSEPVTMKNPTFDAPLLPQLDTLPSSDILSSTNTTNTLPLSPSSSLLEAKVMLPMSGSVITPTPSLSSISSDIPEVAHISVLSPSLPQNHAVTSDDSNGPLDPDPGDANRALSPEVIPEPNVKSIQTVLDTVQKPTAAPQFMEPQTMTGSRLIDAGDEGNGTIEDALSPVLRKEMVFASGSCGEFVNLDDMEVESEVANGREDRSTTVPADIGSETTAEGGKDMEGEMDMIDEPEVMDTLDDLVDDTNGTDVRMEIFTVETQLIQSCQGKPSVDDVDEAAVVLEDGGVEVHIQSRQATPMNDMDKVGIALEVGAVEVHVQSRQATPMNDTDRAGIALEVGAVEGQSLDSQSFTGASTVPTTNSKAVYHSDSYIQSRQATPMNDTDRAGIASEVGAVEGQSLDSQSFTGASTVPTTTNSRAVNHSDSSHGEFEGDSREVETMHAVTAEDKMNVDEDMVQSTQPTPLSTDGSSLTSALCMTQMKSLHSIQLLQCLTHFLRMPARDRQTGVSRMLEDNSVDLKSQGMSPVIERARYPSLVDPRLSTEETLNVDQRLEVLAHALAHASVTLAKDLYPYRGKELETKIDILDKSLQQQFEMIQKLDGRPSGEMYEPFKEFGRHTDKTFDSSTESTSTETLSQGVQTLPSHVHRQFESIEVQTEAENEAPAHPQPLSADSTLVDLTIHTSPFPERPSTPTAETEYQPENNRSVAKTVMSIMRNMADLLECTTQGGSVKSLKGKEKEVTDVDMMPSYLDSPAFTTILEEFKTMKEEMRRSQHRSQSEVESIRLSHLMEVEALKDEIRTIESKGKQKLEEVTRQYMQQIGELKSTRLNAEREEGRDREKESGSEKLPLLELLEIRRRVESLEVRSRSDSISLDMVRSGSRASFTNGELFTSRHPPPHLLPTDFEEQPYRTMFRSPKEFMQEGSMSKPGTPAPTDRNPLSNRHPDVMDVDESVPLPSKSQRKMHMLNFLRPPIG